MADERIIIGKPQSTPINYIKLDGKDIIDISHLKATCAPHGDPIQVLIFYAFKEIKRLSDEIEMLRDKLK